MYILFFWKIDLEKQPDTTCQFNMMNLKRINIENVHSIPSKFSDEFMVFCKQNDIQPPNIGSNKGKMLACMLEHMNHYWDRYTCNAWVNKFQIQTRDSIQIANKFEQDGIKMINMRGKYCVQYPFEKTIKPEMRKGFKFDGNEEEKNRQINIIKKNIESDYVEVANSEWQLGHRNPGIPDSSQCNLVLQPPIQAKYRDNFIFIDTLTKIPVPHKLQSMLNKKEIQFSQYQIKSYIMLFNSLIEKS